MLETHIWCNASQQETQQNKGQHWNLRCDRETHEALDILGAHMVGKEKMPDELKKSLKVPKPTIVKILALEKLKQLGLIKSEVVLSE